MSEITATTLTGRLTSISESAVLELRASIRGPLLRGGEPGYDEARAVYNAMIDRKPALIVRCAGVADVINALKFARSQDLVVSIRCGGHNVAGAAVTDGGVMLDLSLMRGVRVDPVNRTARAQGGATWGDYDHETQIFGLASTGGIAPTTGIGGLTLGGGIGYLNRKYGLACDNLLSADVVTADGNLVKASATENADLFWALRGGGGNFGVVTSFEYRVHPVGPLLAGLLAWPLPMAKEVLRFYRDFSISAPDELRLDAGLATTPGGPAVVVFVSWCGSIATGEEILRPLRTLGPPMMDSVEAKPYTAHQKLVEEMGYKPGFFHYWKSSFFRELNDEAAEAMVDTFATCPSHLTAVVIEHLGGAVGRVGEQETAFSHRQAQHSFLIFGVWEDAEQNETNIQWSRSAYDAVQPFLEDGVYVNYLGDEGEARTQAAYGANYKRLAEVKAKYDPTNFFRRNQNILPRS